LFPVDTFGEKLEVGTSMFAFPLILNHIRNNQILSKIRKCLPDISRELVELLILRRGETEVQSLVVVKSRNFPAPLPLLAIAFMKMAFYPPRTPGILERSKRRTKQKGFGS
jgi:hypothetical protein